jgi:hypothetical protein
MCAVRLYFFLCLSMRRRFLRLCLFIFAFLFFLTLDIKHNSFQKGISIFEIHNMNPATYGGQVTKLKNNIVIKY